MQTLFQEKRMEFVGQRHVSKLLEVDRSSYRYERISERK
jgi:hypothetical protein